jgi:hypothetical protein
MIDVLLFAEDDAQERFVGALIERIAEECRVSVHLRMRSVFGGFGKVLTDLKRFSAACERAAEKTPDIIVVAVDANCLGWNARRERVEQSVGEQLHQRLVLAIADPHVERWLLLDGAAFRSVLGHGCQAPDQKCEKDRYKTLLMRAVQEAGVQPLLGGIEYADELAKQMDLGRAASADQALARFVGALRGKLNFVDGLAV